MMRNFNGYALCSIRFNVRFEYLHDVCFFYIWCVIRSVREIFPHLDTSHDEILIDITLLELSLVRN